MPNRIPLRAPWWAEMTTTEQNTSLEQSSTYRRRYNVFIEDVFRGYVQKNPADLWMSEFEPIEIFIEDGPFESRFAAVRALCSRYDELNSTTEQ